MDADWSVLLTPDLELEVVAGASFVGPAGSVPMGLMGVVGTMGGVKYVLSDIFGVLGADKSSFLHPTTDAIMIIKLSEISDFFMIDSS